MFRLLKFELKKLFKKKSIKFLFLFLFILIVLVVYFSNKKNDYINEIYPSIPVISKQEYEKNYEAYHKLTSDYNNSIKMEIEVYNFYKENNVNNIKEKSILNNCITLIVFLSIIIIFISSSIWNGEFSKKSIKELLTKPFKRYKVLISKILCIFLFILLLTLFISLNYIIVSSLITGNNLFLLKDYIYKNDSIIENFYIVKYFKEVAINSIPLYFISILTIFLSLLINNAKIVCGTLMFTSLMSTMIFQLLLSLKVNIIEYTFLPYLDLSIYKNLYDIYLINIGYSININAGKGIIVLSIYAVSFLILSIIIFNKKDVF